MITSIYADTSVLTAYYFFEPGSERAQAALSAASSVHISDLTGVELCSAISRKFRCQEVSRESAERVVLLFSKHIETGVFASYSITSDHYLLATALITRFDSALRSLDAIHLALSISLGTTLLTADKKLFSAARIVSADAQLLEV